MRKVTAKDVRKLLNMTEEDLIDSVGRVEDVCNEWAAKYYGDAAPKDSMDFEDFMLARYHEYGRKQYDEEAADLFNFNQHVNDGFWANLEYMAEEFDEED